MNKRLSQSIFKAASFVGCSSTGLPESNSWEPATFGDQAHRTYKFIYVNISTQSWIYTDKRKGLSKCLMGLFCCVLSWRSSERHFFCSVWYEHNGSPQIHWVLQGTSASSHIPKTLVWVQMWVPKGYLLQTYSAQSFTWRQLGQEFKWLDAWMDIPVVFIHYFCHVINVYF